MAGTTDHAPGSRGGSSTIQYSSVIDGITGRFYDPNRERSPTLSPDFGRPSLSRRLLYRSHQKPVIERKSEINLERQWEFYRRSVAEGMPDSDYKAAVLAGIAHALMRLDSIYSDRNERDLGKSNG
jgi:hypothetical protein